MMHEPEKSDSVVVAEKPTNKAERSAAESARRAVCSGAAGEDELQAPRRERVLQRPFPAPISCGNTQSKSRCRGYYSDRDHYVAVRNSSAIRLLKSRARVNCA
jgi:hypothetical protein